AARALQVTQASDINSQFVINRQNARSALTAEEDALAGVGDLLQDIRTMTLSAGNATISDSDRMSFASALRGQFDQMMGLANTTDGTGKYIFSGYQTGTPAFVKVAGGAQYQGDQGQRVLQVDTARQLPISDSGDTIFNNIKSGNGTFETVATAGNAGSGVVSLGSVLNPAALTNHNYSVNFSVVAGVTTYDIVDTTVGLPALSTGNAYVSGQSINFGGIQFDVSGAPANGDSFTVQPSTNQSIFETLDDLITLLQTPTSNAAGRTALTAGLAKATGDIDKS
ncbi:MAG: flagellar hook-associated protein FlgL, partial [Pseudomonadota bacterium]